MLIKNCKGLFILLLILSTLASVLASFIPQVIGRMTEILQGREIASAFPFRYFDTPLAVTVLFIVCGLSQIIFSFAAKVTDKFFQSSLTLELKTFLHDKILSLDAAYHDLHPQNENLFNINNAAGAVSAVVMAFSLPVSCLMALTVAVSGLYHALTNVNIPLWLILCIIPALLAQPFAGHWLGKRINAAFTKLRANHMEVNGELLNSLKSPVEVQVMNAGKQRSATVRKALQKVAGMSVKANIFAILDSQFSSICILIFQALIALVIVLCLGDSRDMSAAGSLVTCITLVPVVFTQTGSFIAIYIQWKQAEPEISAIYNIVKAVNTVQETENAVNCPADMGNIAVENVVFGYNGSKNILDGLSVEFPAGKTIAVISRSGGGKSTLLHLLSRLYDPSSGAITLQGNNIKNYTLSSLRDSIVRISQFPLFIQGTLRDNFLLQEPDAGDEEIEDVCRKTGIWEIMAAQSHGKSPLDYPVALGAENLSGGQRRLLSISRAMLKMPSLLLLDEPTTGVDARTVQDRIYPFLEEYKKKSSIIFVDHNMNFVRNLADFVLVIDNGRAADFGPVEEVLAKKDSLFRALWEEYNRNPVNK